MNRHEIKGADSECVVIKVGGSLLAKPGLPVALQNWLQNDPLAKKRKQRVLIVGGGERVNALRTIDEANPLAPEVAHGAAIAVMDQNARLLASWMKTVTQTTSFSRLHKRARGDWVLAPGHFLRQEEPSLPGVRLPVGWEVTSDSIAARLATLLGSSLVLVKSSEPPASFRKKEWKKAADFGYIDPFFSQVVGAQIKVNAVFLGI